MTFPNIDLEINHLQFKMCVSIVVTVHPSNSPNKYKNKSVRAYNDWFKKNWKAKFLEIDNTMS